MDLEQSGTIDQTVKEGSQDDVVKKLEETYGAPQSHTSSIDQAEREGFFRGVKRDAAGIDEVIQQANQQVDYLKNIQLSNYYSPLERGILWLAERVSPSKEANLYQKAQKFVDKIVGKRLPQMIEETLTEYIGNLEEAQKRNDGMIEKLQESKAKFDKIWMGGQHYLNTQLYPKVGALNDEVEKLKQDYAQAINIGRADLADGANRRHLQVKDILSARMNEYELLSARALVAQNISINADNLLQSRYTAKERVGERVAYAQAELDRIRTTQEIESIKLMALDPIEIVDIDTAISDASNYSNQVDSDMQKKLSAELTPLQKPVMNILAGENGVQQSEQYLKQRLKNIEKRHTQIQDMTKHYLRAANS